MNETKKGKKGYKAKEAFEDEGHISKKERKPEEKEREEGRMIMNGRSLFKEKEREENEYTEWQGSIRRTWVLIV